MLYEYDGWIILVEECRELFAGNLRIGLILASF